MAKVTDIRTATGRTINEQTEVVEFPIERGYVPKRRTHRKGMLFSNSIPQLIESLDVLKMGETFLLYPAKKSSNMEVFLNNIKIFYKKHTGYRLSEHGLRTFVSRNRECVIVVKI